LSNLSCLLSESHGRVRFRAKELCPDQGKRIKVACVLIGDDAILETVQVVTSAYSRVQNRIKLAAIGK
jgi:hypothetical protein